MTDWILGLVMAVLAVLGLVLAANAYDTGMYTFGLGLFAFGIFFDFWLVKKSFDAKERAAPAAVAPDIKAAAN
jgi:Zn-dependent membrane protease YugP